MRTALLVCLLLMFSCSWLKSESKPTASRAVDCATDQARAALREFGPTTEAVVRNAIDNAGRIDRAAVKAAAANYTAAVGGCVLRDVFARLLAPVKEGDVQSSGQVVDHADASSAWEEIQRQLGAVYQ